jgi:hypothetical protein
VTGPSLARSLALISRVINYVCRYRPLPSVDCTSRFQFWTTNGGPSMTIKNVACKTKKLVAAGGLALGLVGFGLSAGIGTAVADGHNITDPDGTWGDPDDAESRDQSMVPAVDSYATSSYPAGSGSGQQFAGGFVLPRGPCCATSLAERAALPSTVAGAVSCQLSRTVRSVPQRLRESMTAGSGRINHD